MAIKKMVRPDRPKVVPIKKPLDPIVPGDVMGFLREMGKKYPKQDATFEHVLWTRMGSNPEDFPPAGEWVLGINKGAVGPLTCRMLHPGIPPTKLPVVVNQGNERIEITHWRKLCQLDWPDPPYPPEPPKTRRIA